MAQRNKDMGQPETSVKQNPPVMSKLTYASRNPKAQGSVFIATLTLALLLMIYAPQHVTLTYGLIIMMLIVGGGCVGLRLATRMLDPGLTRYSDWCNDRRK